MILSNGKKPVGYSNYADPDTGEIFLIDNQTEERCEADTLIVPKGSYVVTPQDQREAERRKNAALERAARERIRAQIKQYRGRRANYIFMTSDESSFDDISPDTLARAAYLATYLRYGTNELWETRRTRLTRKQLPRLMNLQQTATDKFWGAVRGSLFDLDEGGCINTVGRTFIHGTLANISPDAEYQRLYCDVLRELYMKIPPRQHKRLGYALKMLPYLNFEYNILCHNPTEKNRQLVRPLTVGEFCEIIGFDKERAGVLARDYGRITFTVGGQREALCKFMDNGSNRLNGHIYINPRLVYKGTNPLQVASVEISFAA